MNRPGMSPGLRLSLAYVVIATVWIIASDRLVTLLVWIDARRGQSIRLFYILLKLACSTCLRAAVLEAQQAANRTG